MKRILFLLALIAGFIACIPAAKALPYFGTDFIYRSASFTGVGEKIVSKATSGLHIYAGYQLNETFSLEAGVHSSNFFKSNCVCLKKESLKMTGHHGSLIAHFPLKDRLRGVCGLGVAHMKHHYCHGKYLLNIKRIIPRVSAGLDFSLTDHLALRAAVVWESTGLLDRGKGKKYRDCVGINLGLKSFI